MAIKVSRSDIKLRPDYTKVIPRFFNTGNERSLLIINKVLQIAEEEAEALVNEIYTEFSSRYREVQTIFLKHFSLVRYLLPDAEIAALSANKKLLIGAYFTMEYSIESAALFNPSIVEDFDQSDAGRRTNESDRQLQGYRRKPYFINCV